MGAHMAHTQQMNKMALSSFPPDIFDHFDTKRTTTFNQMLTPADLLHLLGRETVPLQDYDIYVLGKRPGDSKIKFYTKMRIEHRVHARNIIQGFVGVRFLGGYGFENVANSASLKVMRPTDIQKLVTQDSVSFKKRALVYIDQDHVYPLTMIEPLCHIPLVASAALDKIDKKANARKREAYARKRSRCNDWAHVNREAIVSDNHTRLHRMLLAYKRNIRHKDFFDEFMMDVMKNCRQLERDFKCSQTTPVAPNSVAPNSVAPKSVAPVTAKSAVAKSLQKIPVADIGW
ncbi:FirrV-1-B24 [Feldmannia irregularis virus a]|uniref:FirrV-1-B24 n=1 Tax=Feldmannia irregularis virus a TaxID=231992 RepID=Q6XM12_9PHYC|nr:FirrV-1-B24 [Feldmannia irregularis virus a]AAR26899.1 FirrV-1-B24 [Feldmannia irregularis virus a]